MKKHYYKAIGAASILCLAAMATSCSQDLEEGKVQTDNNPAALNVVKLNFATSALTRGTMYDDIAQMPEDATFGVYGYGHKNGEPTPNKPNFINNGSAKKKDDKYIVHVSGKVATYKTDMPKVQLAAVYPQLSDDNQFKRTGANTYTLTYSLQKDMALQKDLMIGQTEEFEINEQNSTEKEITSGKTINMHHALTAINFAIGDRVPTGYTIEGIFITGLYTNGTCHVDLSNTPGAKRFTWDIQNAKKDTVRIKTNHITTTQVNRTQFTGLKTGNKYDNLTIFMIPQPVGDDAKAEVVLKKDENYGADGNIQEDYRLPLKKITIPLKLKDNKPYKAGQVEKYNIGDNTQQEDLKPLLYFVKKDKKQEGKFVQVSSNTVFNLKTDADKKEITKEGATKYYLTMFTARYVAKTKSTKVPTPLIVAPHKYKIVKITYDRYYNSTYTDKKGNKREKILREKDVKVPEGSVVVEDIKQPDSNDKYGHFTLTFNPKKYPDLPKGKKFDKIYIHIELDGAIATIKQSVSGFPQ